MRWAIATVGTASLVFASGATALVLAPPGHAGANQYVEVIPTSVGNAAPPGSAGGTGSAHVPPRAFPRIGAGPTSDARLAALGKDGRAAAALAASTAPAPAPRSVTGVRAATGNGAVTSPQGSPASAVTATLTGSAAGGLGIALPLLLGTALIAALGIALARLRGLSSRDTAPHA